MFVCSYQEELHKRVHPDYLPVEYGGTGKLGFRSTDELFSGDTAFPEFSTPEFRAMLRRDFWRTALNVGGEAAAEQAAAMLDAAPTGVQAVNGSDMPVNPKGVGYSKKKKK